MQQTPDVYKRQRLNNLLHLIDDQYVDAVNIDSLVDKAIPQILAELDPHSVYILSLIHISISLVPFYGYGSIHEPTANQLSDCSTSVSVNCRGI